MFGGKVVAIYYDFMAELSSEGATLGAKQYLWVHGYTSISEGLVVVSYKGKYVYEVLVNCLSTHIFFTQFFWTKIYNFMHFEKRFAFQMKKNIFFRKSNSRFRQ